MKADQEKKPSKVHIHKHSLPGAHLGLFTRSSEQQLVPFDLRSLGGWSSKTRKQRQHCLRNVYSALFGRQRVPATSDPY